MIWAEIWKEEADLMKDREVIKIFGEMSQRNEKATTAKGK